MTATQLRDNTIVFPAHKQVKLLEYVHALEKAGFDANDILSLQVSTSGQCRVTFSKVTIAQEIASQGFKFGEESISPKFYANPFEKHLQLHIHDVPVWVPDCAVTSALAQYGAVQGDVRHGKLKIREGLSIASGVRFATFKPKPGVTSVPSYVKSCDNKSVYRIYHTGQQPTCRICGSTQHFAAGCPGTQKDAATPHAQRDAATPTATAPKSANAYASAANSALYSQVASSEISVQPLDKPDVTATNFSKLRLDNDRAGRAESADTCAEEDYMSAENTPPHADQNASQMALIHIRHSGVHLPLNKPGNRKKNMIFSIP